MEYAMNLADPDLELVDPTPNVHSLFIQFDKIFFYTKLASRAVVRWSKRMYSCAGICSYEGKCGLCDIALSEPLLKLRPRKDLIQTLLHEMIHAFLFVTNQDQDRGGHGPNFKAHMHRINTAAGLNISIYHDFHDEVELYQTHWWRCDGPCQTWKPHFGIVRRPANRAPGPSDNWFNDHKRKCGGTFVKIKEPEKQKPGKRPVAKKSNTENITKYITNNIKTIVDKEMPRKPLNTITKTSNIVPPLKAESNNTNTVVTTQKNISSSPQINKTKTPILFTGKGNTISDNGRQRTNSAGVLETVRNVWASKQIGQTKTGTKRTSNVNSSNSAILNTTKNKATTDSNSPPKKIMKIDDYFKTKASSILKDIYGEDFKVTQSETSNKLIAVKSNNEIVDCPVCSAKIIDSEINRHLDECLNKDILKNLSNGLKDSEVSNIQSTQKRENHTVKDNLNTSPFTSNKILDGTLQSDIRNEGFTNSINIKIEPSMENIKPRKSDNFIIPSESAGRKSPIFVVKTEKSSAIKVEPGTSKNQGNLEQQICPCCGTKITKPIEEHLDECLAFFDNNTTMPEEGASTSFVNDTIVIDDDDDDMFDETQTFNATGTKSPCPCCLIMIEMREMNAHLDECLN